MVENLETIADKEKPMFFSSTRSSGTHEELPLSSATGTKKNISSNKNNGNYKQKQ